MDLSEGNEEMILIQNLNSLQTPELKDFTQTVPEETTYIPQKDEKYHFFITSKRFYSGRYIIEENEEGFFIVNTRTLNKMLLIKMKTMHGGVIIVSKEPNKKSFTVIKTLSISTLHTAVSQIVGTLHKDGLLLRFTSFDKSQINVTVTV